MPRGPAAYKTANGTAAVRIRWAPIGHIVKILQSPYKSWMKRQALCIRVSEFHTFTTPLGRISRTCEYRSYVDKAHSRLALEGEARFDRNLKCSKGKEGNLGLSRSTVVPGTDGVLYIRPSGPGGSGMEVWLGGFVCR